MNRMNTDQRYDISLHIEEMVLDGFAVEDQGRVISAVQRELQRLLNQGDMPVALRQNRSIERLDGGTVRLQTGAIPEAVGKQVAESLYGGLRR